jgi:four helix bundle protein
MSRGFQDLVVYWRAGALADDIRAAVTRWNRLDTWTAGAQLIRAADSVPANIAEATGRETLREQTRFYVMARGSVNETQQWLTRANARGLPLPPNAQDRADEVGRMLNGLIRKTRARASSNQQPASRN